VLEMAMAEIAAKHQAAHRVRRRQQAAMSHAMRDQNLPAQNQHLNKAHHVVQVVAAVCS
jgi:hypothetical protein